MVARPNLGTDSLALQTPVADPVRSTPSLRTPVQAEVARLFAPYSSRPSRPPLRPPSRPPSRATSSGPTSKRSCRAVYSHHFFCLNNHLEDKVPAKHTKLELTAAGLGEKRISFQATDDDSLNFRARIEDTFPQLKNTGGFELLKISGNTRSRDLSVIPSPDEGYIVQYLSNPVTGIGQAMIYIRPLQRSIVFQSTPTSLKHQGPLTKCLTCDKDFPLNQMRSHIANCSSLPTVETTPCVDPESRDELNTSSMSEEPSCSYSEVSTEETPSTVRKEEDGTVFYTDWRSEPDVDKAAKLYKSKLLSEHEKKKPLLLQMDLQDSIEDQERSLLSFYKSHKTEWCSPLRCQLEGDVAVGEGVNRFLLSKAMNLLQFGFHMNFGNTNITKLFEGEADHLTPSTAQFLLNSDMFLVAGRIIGHSFLQGGPCLAGLSPAIVHVLSGGTPETSTIHAKDCSDIDIRATIQLLEGTAELTPDNKKDVRDLAFSWDLPDVTDSNRKWLHERLLFHAVISRTSRQVKQLRKGLKETKVWDLLQERADIIPKLFPRNVEADLSSHSVLQRILWPVIEEDEDEDEDECSLTDKCRVAGYLRNFIEKGTSTQLKELLKFWTGWEVLPRELTVEVINSDFPKSSTCFETLRLPAHYCEYEAFERDIQACLNSTDSGFGLV